MFKLIAGAFCCALLFSVSAAAQKKSAAAVLTSDFVFQQCGFSIAFPSQPQAKSQVVGTYENRRYYFYQLVVDNKATALSAMCVEVSPLVLQRETAAETMRSFFDEAVAKDVKQIITKKEIEMSGSSVALEYEIETGSGLFVRGRAYLINGKVIQSAFSSNTQQLKSLAANRFLDSFKIVHANSAAPVKKKN